MQKAQLKKELVSPYGTTNGYISENGEMNHVNQE